MKSIDFKILIVDDEIAYQEVLTFLIKEQGYSAKAVSSGEEALNLLKKEPFHLILTDLKMKGMDGMNLLEKIMDSYPQMKVILITGYGTIENAVEAMKKGAFTYFVKSHDPEGLLKEIEKIKNMTLKKQDHFLLETKNEKFKNILNISKKAANSDVNILITGESGTGKEVLARYIHENSHRKKENFVPVNCQAFSENLLESELFGHEKGSFTGAIKERKGRFEEANKGSLFLDEIGEMNLSIQVKLLRILENKAIEKIGSNKITPIDFRLLCATNRNLKEDIVKGSFREDLYYRINTISLHLLPLRERKEDLPMLIDFFLRKCENQFKKKKLILEDGVRDFLLQYAYPGNIRELKNMIERLVVLSENGVILNKYVLPEYKNKGFPLYGEEEIDHLDQIKPLKEIKKEAEAKYIQKVLDQCNGNVTKAAQYLEISRRQLFNKIVEYDVKKITQKA